MPEESKWGYYNNDPPCEHLLALRKFLEEKDMEVWSEHGTGPHGWVNVHCAACKKTYETTLQTPWEEVAYSSLSLF